MTVSDLIKTYRFQPTYAKAILNKGISDLFPPQIEAIEAGLLDGENMIIAVPTASGKTFLAELCMLQALQNKPGRCLYVAPLKALASEKYQSFKKDYADLDIPIGLAIGDADSSSSQLNRHKILIATAEKLDAMMRNQNHWLIESLSVVVLDEIHFINDGLRGPTLEVLAARIKMLNPNVQIIGLSATISNAKQMAKWLGGRCVESLWRPIPLREGVFENDTIHFHQNPNRIITEDYAQDVTKLVMDTLRGEGQALIFVNSRRSAQAVAKQIAPAVKGLLTQSDRVHLNKISKTILGKSSDSTKLCALAAELATKGVAFHHAGLKPHQREAIENAFRQGLIKAIGCTPTLAAGVNLPARRAIIRDYKRFEGGLGQAFIPTSEYKQCAGRAGRPQYDSYGEAVLIAKKKNDRKLLTERYIMADPEPVISKLTNDSALRIHILSSISSGYIYDVKGMLEFMDHTLCIQQVQRVELMDKITTIFEFLHTEGFVEKSGLRFFATPFGNLTSRLYIDPISAIVIRNTLLDSADRNDPIEFGLLHLVCCTADAPLLTINESQFALLYGFETQIKSQLILTPQKAEFLDDVYHYLATIKTAWLVEQWINEIKEDKICDTFAVGPGDIYRHVESIQWLIHAAASIAGLLRLKERTFTLEQLRTRIRNGIKAELLPLIHLKGIGRVRARALFDNKITSPEQLRNIDPDILCQLAGIGLQTAKSIIQQVQNNHVH